MNDAGKQTTSINIQVPTAENLAGRRSLIPISFALVIVFFFFSFVDFKCNGKTTASLTGFNLVTGTHLKTTVPSVFDQNLYNPYDDNQTSQQKPSTVEGDKVGPSLWAILSFAAAIAGIAVFWRKEKKEALYGTALAAAGFVSLIILRSVIKSKVEEQGGGVVSIETDFQFGYWMCLLAFIAAGAISFLRMKLKDEIQPQQEPVVNKLNVFISSSVDEEAKNKN